MSVAIKFFGYMLEIVGMVMLFNAIYSIDPSEPQPILMYYYLQKYLLPIFIIFCGFYISNYLGRKKK